jgi:hypothetical protein
MQVYAGFCDGGPYHQKQMSHDRTVRELFTQINRGESADTVSLGHYRWSESDSKWHWYPAE